MGSPASAPFHTGIPDGAAPYGLLTMTMIGPNGRDHEDWFAHGRDYFAEWAPTVSRLARAIGGAA